MDNFDINKLDTLSLEEMRHILMAEMERDKLLVKENHFVLFRYEVAEGALVLLYADKEQRLVHRVVNDYSHQTKDELFDDEEFYKVRAIFGKIIKEPDYPKNGVERFRLRTGVEVVTEYSCVLDDDGKVVSVIGQYMSLLQTRDDLQDTFRRLNRDAAVVDALQHSYESMIRVDLSDQSFEVLSGTPEVMQASKACKTFMDLGKLFCHYFILPEYQPGFMQFIDDINVQERLQANKVLVFEYQTRNIGFCRARVVPSIINSNGEVIEALFTTERTIERKDEIAILRIAATTDSLTGLYNRFAGDKAISKNLELAEGGIYAIFDCDHFKSINDNLGHPVGDKCLIEVSHALRDTYPHEVIVRLGGDEFVLYVISKDLIEKTNREGFKALLSPLHERLAQIEIPEMKGKSPKMSCGVVAIPAGMKCELQYVYNRADKLLYVAKQAHNGLFKGVFLKEENK